MLHPYVIKTKRKDIAKMLVIFLFIFTNSVCWYFYNPFNTCNYFKIKYVQQVSLIRIQMDKRVLTLYCRWIWCTAVCTALSTLMTTTTWRVYWSGTARHPYNRSANFWLFFLSLTLIPIFLFFLRNINVIHNSSCKHTLVMIYSYKYWIK